MALRVNFRPGNIPVDTPGDQDILSLARQAGFLIDSQCGGQGTCEHCRMSLVSGQLVDTNGQVQRLKLDAQDRFCACQAYPRSDVVVWVPPESRIGDLVPSTADYSPLLNAPVPSPLTYQKMEARLSPPTLQDSCSDVDRIRRELQKTCQAEVHIPEAVLAGLPDQLRSSGWEVSLHLLSCEDRLHVLSSTGARLPAYGWAVDIGTTSLAVALIELHTGAVVDLATSTNPQIAWGADVIARILACDKKGALKPLSKIVRKRIGILQSALLSKNHVSNLDVLAAAVSGNTTMLHLYHGVTPVYLRKEPFIPAFTTFQPVEARQRQMVCAATAILFTCPCVASYVGGDVTAGAVAAGVDISDEVVLFMDLGTNGEVVLGNKDWSLCASTSAGPCFEGGGISCGMRAEKGAIYSVEWDEVCGRLAPRILGSRVPMGICGSGLFEAIAVLFKQGAMDRSGRLNPDHPCVLQSPEGEKHYVLVAENASGTGNPIVLTETDIRSFIYSKAAVYTGVETLLKQIDLSWGDIDRFLIAGSLGTNIDIPAAICLGLFPDVERKKFVTLGNTSLAGARQYMLSRSMQARIDAFAARTTCIELSRAPGFMESYQAALFLPHTDLSRFPSVLDGGLRS